MIRDTSLSAYTDLRDRGMLNERQREVMLAVYRWFDQAEFTRLELAERMGWPINRITPRCLELIDKGFLVEAGVKKQSTGRSAHTLKIRRGQLDLGLAA